MNRKELRLPCANDIRVIKAERDIEVDRYRQRAIAAENEAGRLRLALLDLQETQKAEKSKKSGWKARMFKNKERVNTRAGNKGRA